MKFSVMKGNKFTQTIDLPIEQAHEFIQNNTWSPILFAKSERTQNNFQEAHVIGIDIDEGLTSKEATERLKKINIQFSITFSKSHLIPKGESGPCERFRILIPLLHLDLDSENVT